MLDLAADFMKKPGAGRHQEVVVSIDTETWLQVGTVLKDEKGKLLGSYYFRDVKLNPTFKKGQFQRRAMNAVRGLSMVCRQLS